MDAGYEDGGQFELRTLGGVVLVNVLNADGSMIQVDMGTTTFCSEEIPVAGPSREVVDEPLEIDGNTWRITCVSIGNPHCVIPVDRLSKDMVMALGPLLENHEMFPNRINVRCSKWLIGTRLRLRSGSEEQDIPWHRGAAVVQLQALPADWGSSNLTSQSACRAEKSLSVLLKTGTS